MHVIVTRETLLAAAKFKPVREFKRSVKVIRDAHTAVAPAKLKETFDKDGNLTERQIDHGGAPDWPIRINAADKNFRLLDAYPKNTEPIDASKPVAVNIILTGQSAAVLQSPSPGHYLPTNNVRIHRVSHNGGGA